MAEFEVMLNEERMKRLEQRKQERKKKRKSEAEAIKKEEENRQSMFLKTILSLLLVI